MNSGEPLLLQGMTCLFQQHIGQRWWASHKAALSTAHILLALYATSWTSITAHVGHGRKLSRDREKQDAHCGSSLDVSPEGYGQHG
ncbi:hypothetical protein NECAME_18728 [Necator americanus]|uniref:Uncharacterized protein n=1 Tax=Necator americanus TaxID=51031 RepID=W2SVD2_NECAM|nr:hypothetical protein NECAME_18728 [Necator americanus]ETN72667.1 hypothetical protein NECAME_18728 [Necator americanus]